MNETGALAKGSRERMQLSPKVVQNVVGPMRFRLRAKVPVKISEGEIGKRHLVGWEEVFDGRN